MVSLSTSHHGTSSSRLLASHEAKLRSEQFNRLQHVVIIGSSFFLSPLDPTISHDMAASASSSQKAHDPAASFARLGQQTHHAFSS